MLPQMCEHPKPRSFSVADRGDCREYTPSAQRGLPLCHPNPYPNPYPKMGDSTQHSVSVVAVVSERQGENHFSLNQKPIAQSDRAR